MRTLTSRARLCDLCGWVETLREAVLPLSSVDPSESSCIVALDRSSFSIDLALPSSIVASMKDNIPTLVPLSDILCEYASYPLRCKFQYGRARVFERRCQTVLPALYQVTLLKALPTMPLSCSWLD